MRVRCRLPRRFDCGKCSLVDWIGTYEDHTIAFTDEKHKKLAKAEFNTRLECFAAKLTPGTFVAAGVSRKDQEKREMQIRYDLFVVLEEPFKAKARMAEGSGVTCVIRMGEWAVKIKWLDRIEKEATVDDDENDNHKYVFDVEDMEEMITHLEGCVLVHPITMREDGSAVESAATPLPEREVLREITRAPHDAIMRTNLGRFSVYH